MTEKKGDRRLMQLDLSQLHTDGGTQPRVAINNQTVTEYADALKEGAKFPPVVAFHDGATYWLADGFHRYHAHKQAVLDKIEADVRQGALREAILYSVGANTEHGLRRTNADKRKAVMTMLTSETVARNDGAESWSDNEIARTCKVSQPFVAKMRSFAAGALTSNVRSEKRSKSRAYNTKHGTKAVMNTAKIGRFSRPSLAPKPADPSPATPQPGTRQGRYFPKTPIEMPHDVRWAARAVLHAMGREFAAGLVKELTACLNAPEPKLCPICCDPNCIGDCERDESDAT